jgi:hypothetical protein
VCVRTVASGVPEDNAEAFRARGPNAEDRRFVPEQNAETPRTGVSPVISWPSGSMLLKTSPSRLYVMVVRPPVGLFY